MVRTLGWNSTGGKHGSFRRRLRDPVSWEFRGVVSSSPCAKAGLQRFDLVEQAEREFESSLVQLEVGAEMLDTAEGAEGVLIELARPRLAVRDTGNQALLLVSQDCLRRNARELSDQFQCVERVWIRLKDWLIKGGAFHGNAQGCSESMEAGPVSVIPGFMMAERFGG